MYYVAAIIGLAILMIVHEAGHYFLARRAGMRVTKFSVGFGPTFFKIQPILDPHGGQSFFWFTAFGDRVRFKLWKHDPERHGPTIYQVAMIPFLAYVQIAGLNPLEEIEPNDKGSYANARLLPRILTIAGGPAANYLFASIFFFVAFYFHGQTVIEDNGPPTILLARQDGVPIPTKPAYVAGMQDGDVILAIDDHKITSFEDLRSQIAERAGTTVHVLVHRGESDLTLDVQPEDSQGTGLIGVMHDAKTTVHPLTLKESAVLALEAPVSVVKQVVGQIASWIHGKTKMEVHSVAKMVEQTKEAAEDGWAEFISFLGALSAYLALFNLLPLPALDGGRLVFLGFEAVTRKKPNPKMEAQIHAIGLIMLLGLMLYVTFANDLGLGSK